MSHFLANYNGKQIEVETLKVVGQYTQTNQFYLADQKKITVKINLAQVCRAVYEKHADGSPVYIIEPQLIIRVCENE